MQNDIQNAVLLTNCTLADIERLIDRAIAKRMKEFVDSLKNKPPVLIPRKEAAAMLSVSVVTLDKYGKVGILHPKHVGGKVFYSEEELEHYRQHPPKRPQVITINDK